MPVVLGCRDIDTGKISWTYVVRELKEGVYRYTRHEAQYIVDLFGRTCTCPSRQNPCKHRKDALLYHLEKLTGIVG